MTEKTAIAIINPDGYCGWIDSTGNDVEIFAEACRVAIKALKKQVPNKGAARYEKVNGERRAFCPICYTSNRFYGNRAVYCYKCGQKLYY